MAVYRTRRQVLSRVPLKGEGEMRGQSDIAALRLFQQFVDSCAFVHDDTLHELRMPDGDLNYDQFGSNAFFIGADVCAVDTLASFGEPYLDYLAGLGCLPSTIVVPQHHGPSLLDNLLRDRGALAQFRAAAQAKKLDLSSFYSDSNKPFERLIDELAAPDYHPALHPGKEQFRVANDKVMMRQVMSQAGIPVPEGGVCGSRNEVHQVFRSNARRGCGTLLKRLHWNGTEITRESDIDMLVDEIGLPVVAEMIYAVKSSPVCHLITWRGHTEILFCVDQIIQNWRHYGNRVPIASDYHAIDRICAYSRTIASLVPDHSGICGIDYIVTPGDEVLAVDVNPRFNSSTYPFYFLSAVCDAFDEHTYASFRFARVPVRDLSQVFEHRRYPALDLNARRGVIMLSPFFDWASEKVVRFLYLAVAQSQAELEEIEDALSGVLQECRGPLASPRSDLLPTRERGRRDA